MGLYHSCRLLLCFILSPPVCRYIADTFESSHLSVCGSVLQCAVVCCSVLKCILVNCGINPATSLSVHKCAVCDPRLSE